MLMLCPRLRLESLLPLLVGAALGLSGCSKDDVDPNTGTTTNASKDEDTRDPDRTDDDKGGTDDWGDEDPDEGDWDEEDEGKEEIRACMGCWELNGEMCGTEFEACYEDLACQQLMDCPYACGGTAECIEECMAIIPSGVEPLTAVVECLVCDGGPCEAECQIPSMLAYCG